MNLNLHFLQYFVFLVAETFLALDQEGLHWRVGATPVDLERRAVPTGPKVYPKSTARAANVLDLEGGKLVVPAVLSITRPIASREEGFSPSRGYIYYRCKTSTWTLSAVQAVSQIFCVGRY
jgi:hypothetical protein